MFSFCVKSQSGRFSQSRLHIFEGFEIIGYFSGVFFKSQHVSDYSCCFLS